MPKKATGLTARKVETLKTPGLFADGNGLYLQVTAAGAKTWIFRFQIDGRRRDMGLGSAGIVSLADARQVVLDARRMVRDGLDPIEARNAAKAAAAVQIARATTFRECAEAFIEGNQAGWRNDKHAAQWSSTLKTYAFPVIGDLPIEAVDTTLVLKVIEPLWSMKTETASRLRGRIETVLDYAKVRGLRAGENPARWKGHLDHVLPAKGDVAKTVHHASMPYAELPAFWPLLQAQDGLGARALEFAVLTGTRTAEVLNAPWSEFDLEAAIWTVPGARMKAGIDHRVPLSGPAMALLRKLAAIRENDFVFAGQRPNRPLSQMAMLMVLRRMKAGVTAHGFRATFRTWIAERTAYPHEVAEAALAHTQGDKVVAAYQRGDLFEKRRRLMEEWASFVTTPGAKGDVVALRRRDA